jgi:hypothetical protein
MKEGVLLFFGDVKKLEEVGEKVMCKAFLPKLDADILLSKL